MVLKYATISFVLLFVAAIIFFIDGEMYQLAAIAACILCILLGIVGLYITFKKRSVILAHRQRAISVQVEIVDQGEERRDEDRSSSSYYYPTFRVVEGPHAMREHRAQEPYERYEIGDRLEGSFDPATEIIMIPEAVRGKIETSKYMIAVGTVWISFWLVFLSQYYIHHDLWNQIKDIYMAIFVPLFIYFFYKFARIVFKG